MSDAPLLVGGVFLLLATLPTWRGRLVAWGGAGLGLALLL